MNNVNLTGRLTKDPEVRYTDDGLAIARFTIAVNRQKKNEADYPNCIAFGKTAEVIEKYILKGNRIGVTGRIQTGSYDRNGTKIYYTEVVAEKVDFLETKAERNELPDGFEATDEELPF